MWKEESEVRNKAGIKEGTREGKEKQEHKERKFTILQRRVSRTQGGKARKDRRKKGNKKCKDIRNGRTTQGRIQGRK